MNRRDFIDVKKILYSYGLMWQSGRYCGSSDEKFINLETGKASEINTGYTSLQEKKVILVGDEASNGCGYTSPGYIYPYLNFLFRYIKIHSSSREEAIAVFLDTCKAIPLDNMQYPDRYIIKENEETSKLIKKII